MATKQSYEKRVLARLQSSDEACIKKFKTKAIKYLKKQIELAEDAMEELREKLEEKNELYDELVETPDFERIGTSDAMKSYIPQFFERLSELDDEAAQIHDQISALEKTIELRTKQLADFE